MGKPPMPIVIRKLIKKFFKNQRPPPSMIAQKYTSSLFECWKTHGIDSQKCLQYQQLYDKGMQMDFKANQALQKQMKKYPQLVMAEFMPIPDKMYYKGRDGWDKNAVHVRGRPWRF